MSKKCSICKLELQVEEFYQSKNSKDGYCGRCKKCESERCLEKNLRKRKELYPDADIGIGVGPKIIKSYRGERSASRADGRLYYNTGLPCVNGHFADRLVVNGACVECSKESQARRRKDNIEQARAKDRKKYYKNREKNIEKSFSYRVKNPEKVKESQRKWKQENRAKATSIENLRRASKVRATPSWLTKEHRQKIDLYYKTADRLRKSSGNDLAVDHIIPIKGELVSGLHVPWNLRIIGKSENSSKGNKIDESSYFKAHDNILVAGAALPWNWNKGV